MELRSLVAKLAWPLLGACLGSAFTLALGQPSAGTAPAIGTGPSVEPAREARGEPTENARLDTLAARLSSLENRARLEAIEAPRDAPPADLDPAEEHVRADQEWDVLLSAVDREQPSEWSRSATRSFGGDLGRIAQRSGFKVLETACLTTKCRATLAWSDAASARRGLPDVAGGDYELNCTRSVRLEDEEEGAAQQRATFVLDCARHMEEVRAVSELAAH